MSELTRICLYCQGENDIHSNNCKHCGMALPKKHPQDKRTKINFFIKVFWAIVIFSIVMMYYLPR